MAYRLADVLSSGA